MPTTARKAAEELGNLGWLLERFLTVTREARWAVLASRDGVTRCFAGLPRDYADPIGALASGLHSLGMSAPGPLGTTATGEVRQAVIEHDDYLLFVMGAGHGSLLAVRARPGADAGVIGHEMGQLVRRVGEHLTTPDRTAEGSPAS
ncbi:roadblock/LC7 domain-containing protein [Streptomyces sp. NPDC051018]|uniref:roadblock/LC7 domain-containing protein n=1 Tax=Streptomyces sp. NPDC051018 TaxID=3365639 RepID=UPI00379D9A2E